MEKKNSEHSPSGHIGKVWIWIDWKHFLFMSENLRSDPFVARHGAQNLTRVFKMDFQHSPNKHTSKVSNKLNENLFI